LKPAATRTPTFKLAAARLEFSRDRRFKNALHLAAVAALVFLFVTAGWRLLTTSHSSATVLAELRQRTPHSERSSRALVELELERSTRAALARQVAELNEESRELKSRLDFFNAQSGRPGNTR
jgi:hypothetical protein